MSHDPNTVATELSVDEVVRTEALYRERYEGWSVKHFYSFYRREHDGERSYTWVNNTLQRAGLVTRAPARGKHRRRRRRAPLRGMMLHQGGSTHEWVPARQWDLIITLDDATSAHYSMFFVEQGGTASSFRGMAEVIERQGCRRACTPTAVRTTSRPKPAARWIGIDRRSSDARWRLNRRNRGDRHPCGRPSGGGALSMSQRDRHVEVDVDG